METKPQTKAGIQDFPQLWGAPANGAHHTGDKPVRNDLLPLGFSVLGQAVHAKSGCFSLTFALVSLPLWLFPLLFPVVLANTTRV